MRISLFLLLGVSIALVSGCAGRRHRQIASRIEGVTPRVFAALRKMGVDRQQRCSCDSNLGSNHLVMTGKGDDSTGGDVDPTPGGTIANTWIDNNNRVLVEPALLNSGHLLASNPRLASNLSSDEKDLIEPVDENFWNEKRANPGLELSPPIAAVEALPRPGLDLHSVESDLDDPQLDQLESDTIGNGVQFSYLDGRSTMIRLKATTPIGKTPRRDSVATINLETPRFVGGSSHLLTQPMLESQPEIDYQMRPTIDHQRLQESLRRLTIRPTDQKNR